MVLCPSCNEENPARFRLCGFCGATLVAAPPPQEQRKTVSIVFSDLRGSTALAEQLDPEALRSVMTRYFDTMKAELMRHGGTIEKFIGDAIMAVFGIPVVREDDALRAVRAADGMRAALETLNAELERTVGVRLANRTGVNTGEVITGDAASSQRLVTGDAVNTAARLEQAAGVNEILLGDLTWTLVRDAVEVEAVEPLELKGKAERVAAHRLIRVHGMEGRVRRGDAPLVGREHELVRIGEAFRDVVQSARAGLVTVVADAGTGKSRLVKEFTRAVADDAEVVHGRCLPYGDGITFWPLIEIVRGLSGIAPEDAPPAARQKLLALVGERDVAARLASVMGLATAQFPLSEIQWAARRLFELLTAARQRPVVAIIDDIHWAEEAFLDLLEHLHETTEASLLVLATTRHDLYESREAWGSGERSTRLDLQPLTVADAGRIVDALLGTDRLPADVRTRIAEASEGNPLYVEQLLSMLIESGALRRTDDGWIRADDSREIPVPPTIAALLTARLDRLTREERAVIEPASVVGLTFGRGAVASMTGATMDGALTGELTGLTRKQLVRPVLDGEGATVVDAFRFAHLLVRDATYATLLKRTRADLHQRFVAWADVANARADRGLEFEEILGWHLEQAYAYLVELGTIDDHARRVGADGAGRLAAAGRRAYARGDLHAAVSLFSRASALLQPHDDARLTLGPDLAEVLLETGDFARAREVVAATAEAAEELFDDRLEARARLVGRLVDYYTGEGEQSREVLLADAMAAIAVFERAGDDAGMARAWRFITYLHGSALRFEEMTGSADRLVEHAQRAGDQRLAARGAVAYTQAALYGPTPVVEAVERSEQILAGASEDRRTQALVLTSLSELYAMAGDLERGRDAYLRARQMFQQLGNRLLASSVSTNSWRVEWLAGDLPAAAAELRRDRDDLEALGEQQLRSSVAGSLSLVEAELGDLAAAERHSAEAEAIAEADDLDGQARWRVGRARARAAAGETAVAQQLLDEAVSLLRQNDGVVLLADTLTQLAVVRQAASDPSGAEAARSEAEALYAAKGDVVSSARVKALRQGA